MQNNAKKKFSIQKLTLSLELQNNINHETGPTPQQRSLLEDLQMQRIELVQQKNQLVLQLDELQNENFFQTNNLVNSLANNNSNHHGQNSNRNANNMSQTLMNAQNNIAENAANIGNYFKKFW